MDDDFQRVQAVCNSLELSADQLLLVKQHMLAEIKSDLKRDADIKAPIKCCWPTFVQDIPSGCEHGLFLVVTWADSSIQISLYTLNGEHDHNVETEFHEISEELLVSENVQIFDYISQCLQKFLQKRNKQRDPLPLAINFFFPLRQESLTAAMITRYTESFKFKGLEEVDLGKAIKEAILHKNPRVELVALLNDATGVLLSCCRKNPKCTIGIVVGMSTNVAYLEKTEEITQLFENGLSSKPTMVVHYDWGAFGENGSLDHIRSDLDRQVDRSTTNEGHRLFEKLVTGVYVAEMARCLFMRCTEDGILFGGEIGRILKTPFSFTNRHLVEVLAEEPGTFDNTRLMFDRLGVMKPSDSECAKVRYILECVTRRSAALIAAAIACLLDKIGDQHTVVAIDGSLYRNNSVYHEGLQETLSQLIGDKCTFELRYAEDGRGQGSAILAALAVRQKFIYEGSNDGSALKED